jgi:hypothetical protein
MNSAVGIVSAVSVGAPLAAEIARRLRLPTRGSTVRRDAERPRSHRLLGPRRGEEVHAEWLDLPQRPRRVRVTYALRVGVRAPWLRLAEIRRAVNRSRT